MTYSVTGTIQAADYNGFANDSANNLGNIWGVGSGDKGWGQTAISNVSVGGTVTALQWATLVANLATAGQQTSTTLTSRTQPQVGNTITILANVATDIDTVTVARGNAAVAGTQAGVWSGNIAKLTATGSGNTTWTITWTQTFTFANANAARYFWNGGGIVRLDMGKTGATTDADPDWNTFVKAVGNVFFTGRVAGGSQKIGASTYTGTTVTNNTIVPSPNLSTTGWYTLTPGGANTTLLTFTNTSLGYTNDTITVKAAVAANAAQLTMYTVWTDGGTATVGATRNISGGTDTTSPNTTIVGTAPTVLPTIYPPAVSGSGGYLSNSWGTITINSTIA